MIKGIDARTWAGISHMKWWTRLKEHFKPTPSKQIPKILWNCKVKDRKKLAFHGNLHFFPNTAFCTIHGELRKLEKWRRGGWGRAWIGSPLPSFFLHFWLQTAVTDWYHFKKQQPHYAQKKCRITRNGGNNVDLRDTISEYRMNAHIKTSNHWEESDNTKKMLSALVLFRRPQNSTATLIHSMNDFSKGSSTFSRLNRV